MNDDRIFVYEFMAFLLFCVGLTVVYIAAL